VSSRWWHAAAVPAAAALLIAGCGSKPASAPERATSAAAPPQLAAAITTAAGTSWAIVVMGGSSSQHNDFWQLFARPAAAAKWRQVTPTGVADNGGLVAGVIGPGSLVTGFRPSQDLSFSPLAATADSGATWSAGGPVSPGLADVPDALAAAPGGQLLALTQGGSAQLGTQGGTTWAKLASTQSLARTSAGQACGLTGLTAVAFGSAGAAGAPLVAGSCDQPGIAGIFALRNGTWQSAGPPLPAPLKSKTVTVLRMATAGARTDALVQSGTGPSASVLAAWSADGGGHWQVSGPLRTGTATVRSASFGPDGAVGLVLGRAQNQARGVTLAGPGAPWRTLPALPRWTATLAVGPAGRLDALTAHASSFADWQLPARAQAWSNVQTINVTIPYGSSG
jgi:hypothetical protein